MKKLSDYKGEAAIELWCDLLDPLTEIFTDKKLSNVFYSGGSPIEIAKTILKKHSKAAEKILLRIDDTPINGLNLVVRLVEVITEIGKNEELKSFFGYAEQASDSSESSGSVTENTEADEN